MRPLERHLLFPGTALDANGFLKGDPDLSSAQLMEACSKQLPGRVPSTKCQVKSDLDPLTTHWDRWAAGFPLYLALLSLPSGGKKLWKTRKNLFHKHISKKQNSKQHRLSTLRTRKNTLNKKKKTDRSPLRSPTFATWWQWKRCPSSWRPKTPKGMLLGWFLLHKINQKAWHLWGS